MNAFQLATFFQSPFNLTNEQVDELAKAINTHFKPKEISSGQTLSEVGESLEARIENILDELYHKKDGTIGGIETATKKIVEWLSSSLPQRQTKP